MKRFNFILIFVFLSQIIFAQETKPNSAHEFGLNINALLDQTIFNSPDDNPIGEFNISPIYAQVLTYRYYYGKRSALRGSIGFITKEKSETMNTSFAITIRDQNYDQATLNFGFQRIIKMGERTQFYFGGEIRYVYEKLHESFEQTFTGGFGNQIFNNYSTTYGNQIGFSFPVGIQFYLTDRISISTEGNLQVYSLFENRSTLNNGGSRNSYKTNFTGFSSSIPNILFLNFKF